MLRNIKHYLSTQEGAEMHDLVVTVIFFIIFAVMLYLVWRMPKQRVDELKNMPFNDQNENDYDTTK